MAEEDPRHQAPAVDQLEVPSAFQWQQWYAGAGDWHVAIREIHDLMRQIFEEQVPHRYAIALGKAMRFGAMLTASENQKMGKLKYFPKKKRLELKLAPGTRDLFGEVAEARLESLASALGAEEVSIRGRDRCDPGRP